MCAFEHSQQRVEPTRCLLGVRPCAEACQPQISAPAAAETVARGARDLRLAQKTVKKAFGAVSVGALIIAAFSL